MGRTIRKNEDDEYLSENEARKQAKLRKQKEKEDRRKRKERDNYEEPA